MRAERGWSDGPAVRSKDNRLVSGHSWARPVTPSLLGVCEVRVDLACDVAFQDAHDLAGREPFAGATRDVFAGSFVAAHASEHDAPQRMVCLAVPARVEPVPDHFA